MARKSTATSNSIASLKTGDIIWVPYRKSPKWPAVIKNVYPKKITYFFLPESLNGKNPTFKTSPKSVSLFRENDALPPNANKDLQEAYKAALGIVRGEIHLHSVSTVRRNSETEGVSPSTSQNSSLVDVPVKKPRRMNPNDSQDFQELTVILVDSKEKSGWPALLVEVGESEAGVRHFPLVENKDTRRYPFSFCHNVTYQGLEALIAANDCKGCPEYVKALVASQEYIENPQNNYNVPVGWISSQKPIVHYDDESTTDEQKPVMSSKANDIDMAEVKDITKISKFNQNGLTLSNLSISSSKNDIFKAMLSHEAREYIGKIFAGQHDSKRNANYERAEDASDAKFSFYCGEILNFGELEMVVTEIHNWIALSPKLPKMSLLGEMHYVANVVLPELCIFALGRINRVGQLEAEKLYEKIVKKQSKSTPAVSNKIPKTVNQPFIPKSDHAFQELLRAVESSK